MTAGEHGHLGHFGLFWAKLSFLLRYDAHTSVLRYGIHQCIDVLKTNLRSRNSDHLQNAIHHYSNPSNFV